MKRPRKPQPARPIVWGDILKAGNHITMPKAQLDKLKAARQIDYIPDSRGEINVPCYKGQIVKVTD